MKWFCSVLHQDVNATTCRAARDLLIVTYAKACDDNCACMFERCKKEKGCRMRYLWVP